MHAFVIIFSALLCPTDVQSQLPDVLRRVIDSRDSKTSEIEWTISYLQGRDAGLTERHITRTAGDTLWQVNNGDDNEYHRRAVYKLPKDDSEQALDEASIPKETLAGPRHSLLYDRRVWYLQHSGRKPPLVGTAFPVDQATSSHPLDFRAGGLAPWWEERHSDPVLGIARQSAEGFESATYTVESRGREQVVTATFSGKRLVWEFDEARGAQPVSAAFYAGDRLVCWSHTQLRKTGERWFPESITFYRGEDEQPHLVLEVHEVSFDEPRHLQQIVPEDIGVLFGTQLLGPTGYNRWDGTRLITGDEYDELLFVDGLRPDPYILEKLAEAMGMTVEEYLARMDRTMEQWRARYLEEHGEAPWLAKKTNEPDPWDLYVAEFIKKHKLDEPRIKQANDILKKAKKLRDYHERKNRSEIAKAQRARDEEKLAHYEQISERIFQKVLVHGLEKLVPDDRTAASDKEA